MERACGGKSRVRGGRRRAVARHEHGARAAAAALELGAGARHDECRRCAPGRAAAPELVIAGVVKVRAEQAELAARRAVAQARHDTGALERRVARQGEIVHREQPQPVAPPGDAVAIALLALGRAGRPGRSPRLRVACCNRHTPCGTQVDLQVRCLRGRRLLQPDHVSTERHYRRGDEGAAVGPVVNRAMVVGVVDADIVGSGAERLRRRLHGESYGCPWPREGRRPRHYARFA